MVVTEALPEQRVILSINAEPAAEEYARLIGVEPRRRSARGAFAAHPLLMRQGGRHVVRAIQAVTPERRPEPDVLGRDRHDDDARPGRRT